MYQANAIIAVINAKYELLCWQHETNSRIKASKIQKVIDKFTNIIQEMNQGCYNQVIDNSQLEFIIEHKTKK